MKAKFQNYDLETLQNKVDCLVARLLALIYEERNDEIRIDVESVCEELEEFAGRDYIVATKLENGYVMSQWDKEYLIDLLKKES